MKKPPFPSAIRSIVAACFVALWAVPASVGHAQLPALGDGAALSTGAERQIGERIAREIYADPDYLEDPVLDDYVRGIWTPLLGAARRLGELPAELDERFAWQILLVRDRAINAFALPGGYLGLNLGLIGAVASRDELASVLAHELSHVTQRHIARMLDRQNQQTPLLLGAMILGAIAASKNPDAANAVLVGGQALAAQQQLSFSRDMEREADRVGFGVMTAAGFSPPAFVSMFEKLQQASRLNDDGSYPYLRSHPLTTERIAEMRARDPDDPKPPPALTPAHAMAAARARVLASPGVDALRVWAREPERADFAQQPLAQQAGALYAAALAQQRLGAAAAARRTAQRLAERVAGGEAEARRQARLLQAQLALAAGDAAAAAALLTPANATPGEALPRPERLLHAEADTARGDAAGAIDLLQPWLSDHPRDARAWQLLAAAARAQGQGLRALRAEGEARVAVLDYAGALDRFRAGQTLAAQGLRTPAEQIEAAIIDSRARQVQAQLREQLANAKEKP